MIKLVEAVGDSADSGRVFVEVISECDHLWVRIIKPGPEAESFRPKEIRDPAMVRLVHLNSRTLEILGTNDTGRVWE